MKIQPGAPIKQHSTLFFAFIWCLLLINFLIILREIYRSFSCYDTISFKTSELEVNMDLSNVSDKNNNTVPWWKFRVPIQDRTYENISDSRIFERLQKKYTNFPFVLWDSVKNRNLRHNSTCLLFPNIYKLDYNSQIWQQLTSSNGTYYILGAYYDDRPNVNVGPVVRILAMLNRIHPTLQLHCQFWNFKTNETHINPMKSYFLLWNLRWGKVQNGLQPYLLTCPTPPNFVPDVVSLVEKPCDEARNLMIVHNNRPYLRNKRKKFAVCVKGLNFPHDDISVRLIEWLELLRLLGANHVYFYNIDVHPNVTRVLNYYASAKDRFVDVSPLTLPGNQPNLSEFFKLYHKFSFNNKRRNEVIPYNDCFYRNIYLYEYIVLLDIDEIIIPKIAVDWNDLIDSTFNEFLIKRKNPPSSFNIRNVYFFDIMKETEETEIPSYLHMLQHVYRSRNFTLPGQYIKSFHSTDRVLGLHNHYPFGCITKSCQHFSIRTDRAQLQHYRKDCVKELSNQCSSFKQNLVKDTTIWRYKKKLILHALNVMQLNGII